MACTVAPRKESNKDPASPARVTIKNVGKGSAAGLSTEARIPISAEPARDANVPNNEIPPEVPFSTTFFKFVMTRGGCGFSTPNSVAHVSALTAASAAANPIHGRVDSGKK